MIRRVALAAALLSLVAVPLRAQVMSGRVREGTSGVAVTGAVVDLLDATGKSVARGLTNANGQYRVLLPAAARSVRVSRIGFRPREIPVAANTETLDITVAALPSLLAPIVVVDQPNCPRRADRASALALWEQARAALLATVVARESDTAMVRRINFFRIVGQNRPGHIGQLVRIDTQPATESWTAALQPEEFVRGGFVVTTQGSRQFFAPDADVLLSEAFTSGYCFHLAEKSDAHPGAIGLGLRPARRSLNRVDIEGTLWIDSVRHALEELEFRYVGLGQREGVGEPGGHVSFRAMPNGSVLVDRWMMRFLSMPAVAQRDEARRRSITAVGERRIERPQAFVSFIRESGGELSAVRFRDGTTWQAKLSAIRGRLTRDSVPVANALVYLVGTDYRARTDSAGEFEMRELIPAIYTFAVADQRLNAVGLERTRAHYIDVKPGKPHYVDIAMPTDGDVLAGKCESEMAAAQRGGSMLAGRVRTSDGSRAVAANLQVFRARGVTMHDSTNVDAAAAGNDVKWERLVEGGTGVGLLFDSVYDGEVGSGGTFAICGIEPGWLFRVEARLGNERGVAYVASTPRTSGRRVYTVDLTLRPR